MNKQTQTNKKQDKQTNWQTKNSTFRNNRISILVWVLVLLLQHPILVLVFKQKLCHSLARWLGSVCFFFPFCLSEAAAWSAPPSVGCGSLSLYVVLRFWNQLCRSPAVLLWSWVFTVFDYWGLVSLACPFSLGQSQWSISWPPAVSVLIVFQFCTVIWLWMLLTGSGDEFCALLPALFQAAAITSPLSALLPFQPLFTESLWEDQLLAPPPFSSMLSVSCLLWYVLVFSSLFIVQFIFFFLQGRASVSLPRGPCWFILEVSRGNCMTVGVHLLVCQMSPKQVWSQHLVAQQPSSFLSVTWHGEAFHRLGVQDVKVLILLVALFLPSVAPASQQGFGVSSSCCLLLRRVAILDPV
jgi:hypothetical protein